MPSVAFLCHSARYDFFAKNQLRVDRTEVQVLRRLGNAEKMVLVSSTNRFYPTAYDTIGT
jgi:hypothetical protein